MSLDNLAIGATQVLPGGYRWGFTNLLVLANSKILVLAADEPFGPFDDRGVAGSLGVSVLNPDGVVDRRRLLLDLLSVSRRETTGLVEQPREHLLERAVSSVRPPA